MCYFIISKQGEASKPVPFTIFGVLAVLCSLLMLLLRETVGKPLPDRLQHVGVLAGSHQREMLAKNRTDVTRLESRDAVNGYVKCEPKSQEIVSRL